MTFFSGYHTDGTAGTVIDSPAVGHRLRLKPPGAAKGCFDGGWWPRTRDPVTEFSALVTALSRRSGRVDRIAFNPTTWDVTPRQLAHRTGVVRLVSFHGLDPYTIVMIGPRIHRLTLLVIPPPTDPDAAERALTTASAPENVGSTATILTASGVVTPTTDMT